MEYTIDNLPPFASGIRSSVRIKQIEKRHFVDPSLTCVLLKTTPAVFLGDIEALGFLFEALCERDLRIYAESFGATLYHYQEYRGQEMDAVVELPDGQWCISTAGWSLCGSVMTQAKETAVVAF